MIKSPFLIIKDFLSPLECESIVKLFDGHFSDYDKDNNEIKTTLSNALYQQRVWTKLEEYFSYMENWYSVEIDSISHMDIEWYPQDCVQEALRCENSQFISKQWRLINNNDFTVIIFLMDYNDSPNFDPDFECYGGKVEFPNHKFSFMPQRGTVIIFPSNQYFLNRTLSPVAGDAFQLRLQISANKRFKYNPKSYEGDFTTWFSNLT